MGQEFNSQFDPEPHDVRLVANEAALGQILSEDLGVPLSMSFSQRAIRFTLLS